MGRFVPTNSANGDMSNQILLSLGASQTPDRIVFLSGDVNEHSISSVIAQLIGLANQNKSPIHLIVRTTKADI